MGHFRLNMLAVGGHGCEREKGDGVAVLGCNRPHCPDCITREYIRRLQRGGSTIVSAKLTHWPADEPGLGYVKENEVVDDLLAGVRLGSFDKAAQNGPGLTFLLRSEAHGVVDATAAQYTTNRRTVRGVLEEVLGPPIPAQTPREGDSDYPTESGVYWFTNPGGSNYNMQAELRSILQGWSNDTTRPWHIKKIR
jgi:hypothetical protein